MQATATLPSYAMNQVTFPEMYERSLVGPLFRPWAEVILDAIGVSAGDRVLDIACGTGIVARLAKERLGTGAQVVGVDVSPDMLATARAVAPDIDFRAGDAGALPLRDGERFERIFCHQGLQFFPDKAAAAAQMRRALAPGGRLAVAVWCPDEEMPFLRELRRVAERHLGAIDDKRYALGDANTLAALLREAGLREVAVGTRSLVTRFQDGASFVRMNTMAFIGMSTAGKTMDEAQRKRLVEGIASESLPVMRDHSDAQGLAFEMRTILATATA